MTDQYRMGTSDVGPEPYLRGRRWFYFWEAIKKAHDGGYPGWVTISLPNAREVGCATGSLLAYKKGREPTLEYARRKQDDNTYTVYARIPQKQG